MHDKGATHEMLQRLSSSDPRLGTVAMRQVPEPSVCAIDLRLPLFVASVNPTARHLVLEVHETSCRWLWTLLTLGLATMRRAASAWSRGADGGIASADLIAD